MYEITKYNKPTIEKLKERIFRNTNHLLDEIEYMHEILKALNREMVYCVLNDKDNYADIKHKYEEIKAMLLDLNALKNDSIQALKPLSELVKAESEHHEITLQKPILIDVTA